ncbi:(NiFe) hydrogenase maturation protein HypF (plasmid) [Rhizobium leguminosarum bv. trifolii WSM2304]|uniref:Carbamoyltransferase HypF n=1 Tax=Rhizobium leguminosarum bv. trifolii (strain WSM2304) TaxID=395492 RepID=A0ABF7QZ85_RHILW|nr:carbamoyltransferase HypF [Rhizobium leguminosarum]ACI59556.1 (NiFe) hydrogenase maturation protein HypF [Rhizobium leguminosarum bv. trifolii WSM2304]
MIGADEPDGLALEVRVQGIVQGVGFRPFVYTLANRYELSGWVANDTTGVTISVQGPHASVEAFMEDLTCKLPTAARIDSVDVRSRQACIPPASPHFTIRQSSVTGQKNTLITPDLHVCPDCEAELFDPNNRRYRYPFINCTNCGPRYSIILDTPYDRPNTTMSRFQMCPACLAEYRNPLDRRYHAQPIACGDCGPTLRLTDTAGQPIPAEDAIEAARDRLADGQILAVKGIGGFHLIVDPRNPAAVATLRSRKRRYKKPLALMCRDSETASKFVSMGAFEKATLESAPRPIVLLDKLAPNPLAPDVSAGTMQHGMMLAYTPIHHLLLDGRFDALIVTSANLSDDPIEFRNDEAIENLSAIADAFLVHDRDIHARVDDSVLLCWTSDHTGPKTMPVRRARGYAPDFVPLPQSLPPILALGAELKNTICVNRGNQAFLSPHVGDLKRGKVLTAFHQTIAETVRQHGVTPELMVCDLHPQFLSTEYANSQSDLPILQVQHHHAHMAAVMGENGLCDRPTIGVVFDGFGLGEDGNNWGGEFFVGSYASVQRVGHFSNFKLPGGDRATREIDRIAIGFLFDLYGENAFNLDLPVMRTRPEEELRILQTMIGRSVRTPLTSSVGRLFDAVAALTGVRSEIQYEAQAAIELEALAGRGGFRRDACLPVVLRSDSQGRILVDTHALMAEIAQLAVLPVKSLQEISHRFHATVVLSICEVCGRLRDRFGISNVVLSGGVFLNRFILSQTTDELARRGFDVFSHRQLSPGDGGISYGQLLVGGYSLLDNPHIAT